MWMGRWAAMVIAGFIASPALAAPPHNVILFVPDGLRALMVTPDQAPAMAALRDAGVSFKNSHSMFPTLTTANASAFATGHSLGDTGDFANTIYSGYLVPTAANSMTPFLESDPVLGDVDEHFAGNYLNETTVLKAAFDAGYNAAAIGKLGPTLIFAHTERSGQKMVVVDDQTGSANGIALPNWLNQALFEAKLPLKPPSRGGNGKSGSFNTPGTTIANIGQESWFTTVATDFVLPRFKRDGKPFVLVYWSRDPDGSQHNQGDSLNTLTPGINGPTSLAGIRNADDQLARLRKALVDQGLDATTDIIVAADHGFSTISRESATSPSTQGHYEDVPPGFLPPGFLALDLAKATGLKLWDPDKEYGEIGLGAHPSFGSAVLGPDPLNPMLVVAANGGSDLIYLPQPASSSALVPQVIAALLAQDYVSGIFVDDRLGKFAGTLPLSTINLAGTAATPTPSIVVNFRSFSTGCPTPVICSAEIADTTLQQGQGMHGSFGRGDTNNFMAAIGPDFKRGFVDEAPVSNADIGRTVASLLGLKIVPHGRLVGRVMAEALNGGTMPKFAARVLRSEPAANGLATVLIYQELGETRYFDAAGFPGKTVGLSE